MKKRKIRFLYLLPFLFFLSVNNPLKAQRIIHFAGVDWEVKNGGPYGPGPNYWSDSPQSVWVDESGALHLKIIKIGSTWYCAEVRTVQPTQYGEHRFLVDGYIDRMDKNMVLGLFVYADDAAEIDIEYSKWGDPNKTDVGSFTVQPYTTPGNQYTFESPLDSAATTHFFDWQPGYVMFGSMHGHYYGAPPSQNYYIAQWVYSGNDNPDDSENLHTHINYWLMNGQAPENLDVQEIIINDVVQPLSTSTVPLKNKTPHSMELAQNYPNPFNDATRIEYFVKAAGKSLVDLSVFDLSGRKVKTLVHTLKPNGRYSVLFNARNLGSGIYFYKLKTGKSVLTRKMILLR